MPKIPTFTAEKSITSEPSSVVSNIKLSPRSTVASALIPAAKQVQAYAIKKRDNEEKLQAKKTLLELKAESDKIVESQKDNPNEQESIDVWKTNFQNLSKKIKTEYRNTLLNKTTPILFENKTKNENEYFGRDECFNSVIVPSNENLAGKIKNIKITKVNQNTLFGEINSKKLIQKNYAA